MGGSAERLPTRIFQVKEAVHRHRWLDASERIPRAEVVVDPCSKWYSCRPWIAVFSPLGNGKDFGILTALRLVDLSSLGHPRILMVTPRYSPLVGGVESHVAQVCQRLVRKGAHITVLTADPSRKLPRAEQIDGVKVERVPAWPSDRDYYFSPAVYPFVRHGGWDLVHIQSYHTLVPPFAMLAALRAGIPYVLTFHGGGHSSRFRHAIRPFQRALLRPLLVRARRLVAVASFEIDLFGRELGIMPESFVLIPNGCDLPPVPSTGAYKNKEGTLIASVGRLERYKGHHRVLAALPHVIEKRPDVRLWIAGTGPYESELRKLGDRLGVSDRVEIKAVPAGDREEMAARLAQAGLFVLLSEYETHPIAVLEALSLGCPALVASTSGLRELADRGLARAIPLDAPSRQVAEAVLDQLEHPFLPARLDLPTWDECAEGLRFLYESILRRRICAS